MVRQFAGEKPLEDQLDAFPPQVDVILSQVLNGVAVIWVEMA